MDVKIKNFKSEFAKSSINRNPTVTIFRILDSHSIRWSLVSILWNNFFGHGAYFSDRATSSVTMSENHKNRLFIIILLNENRF